MGPPSTGSTATVHVLIPQSDENITATRWFEGSLMVDMFLPKQKPFMKCIRHTNRFLQAMSKWYQVLQKRRSQPSNTPPPQNATPTPDTPPPTAPPKSSAMPSEAAVAQTVSPASQPVAGTEDAGATTQQIVDRARDQKIITDVMSENLVYIDNPFPQHKAMIYNVTTTPELEHLSLPFELLINDPNGIPHSFMFQPMTLQERESSTNFWIRSAQVHIWRKDFVLLQNGQPLPNQSKILSFQPYYCQQTHLIRVGGRLRHHPTLPEECRHQIMLPRNTRICDKLIMFYHTNQNHVGAKYIHNQLIRKYWLTEATIIKFLKGDKNGKPCLICRIRDKPQPL